MRRSLPPFSALPRNAILAAVIASAGMVASCGSSDESDAPQSCPECASDSGLETGEEPELDAAADSSLFDAEASMADQAVVEAGHEASAVDVTPGDASPTDASAETAADSSHDAAVVDVALETDAQEQEVGQPETGSDAPLDAVQEDSAPELDVNVADASPQEASTGIITGGPCLSGAPGQTAYRIKWIGSGNYPQLVYEVNGLPDQTDHTGVYGYNVGFTPQFVDPYLGEGGLLLDSSDFIDIELSTVGVSAIKSITLSIYGRSFNTTASGSFTWQTFEGAGSAPSGLVSNSAPYEWYSADMTGDITAGNDNVLLRIKAGPPSGSLVVNRLELCMEAD